MDVLLVSYWPMLSVPIEYYYRMNCITLLSDFGSQDAGVAIARGILMRHAPVHTIIDISHEIAPFQIGQAAYLLDSAYKHFPTGTVHILLFDIFSQPLPRLVLVFHNDHYFLAPDNGLLPLALGSVNKVWECLVLNKGTTFSDWLNTMGILINQLSESTHEALGLRPTTLKSKTLRSQPALLGDTIFCDVIHIDHYENVVLNITRQEFETLVQQRPFTILFMAMEEISEISTHYRDVRDGYKLCRFNSNDHLEICVNKGKAASLFGLRLGGKNNNIKIIVR